MYPRSNRHLSQGMDPSLHWIKYHRDYKQAFDGGELAIDESTMDWMNGEEEAELPSITLEKSDYTIDEEANIGVSKTQVADPELDQKKRRIHNVQKS